MEGRAGLSGQAGRLARGTGWEEGRLTLFGGITEGEGLRCCVGCCEEQGGPCGVFDEHFVCIRERESVARGIWAKEGVEQ